MHLLCLSLGRYIRQDTHFNATSILVGMFTSMEEEGVQSYSSLISPPTHNLLRLE